MPRLLSVIPRCGTPVLLIATLSLGAACSDDPAPHDAVDAGDATDGGDVATDATPDGADGSVDGGEQPCAAVEPTTPAFAARSLIDAAPPVGQPTDAVSDVLPVDLDGDGFEEFLFAEPAANRIRMLDACETACVAVEIAQTPGQPARIEVADLDGDGAVELVIAGVGAVDGSDDPVGSVQIARQVDDAWEVEIVAEELQRVACAYPMDLDEDGALDIVVCEFGDVIGFVSVLWGGGADYEYARLYEGAGAVDLDVIDVDGDGGQDLVVGMSQLQEQVVLLHQDSGRTFSSEVLFDAGLTWFGHSSIDVVDLDGDGLDDIVFTNGDPGDLEEPILPMGLHGVNVLWNRDGGTFEYERLADLYYAYSTAIADFDGDCALDIAVFRAPALGPELDLAGPDDPPAILVRPALQGAERILPIGEAKIDVVSAVARDIDGDGDVDILVGQMSATGVVDGALVYVLDNAPAP